MGPLERSVDMATGFKTFLCHLSNVESLKGNQLNDSMEANSFNNLMTMHYF